MSCLFLSGNYMKYCIESRENYIPSSFEMEEYCTSRRHTLCPLFSRRQAEFPSFGAHKRWPAPAVARQADGHDGSVFEKNVRQLR